MHTQPWDVDSSVRKEHMAEVCLAAQNLPLLWMWISPAKRSLTNEHPRGPKTLRGRKHSQGKEVQVVAMPGCWSDIQFQLSEFGMLKHTRSETTRGMFFSWTYTVCGTYTAEDGVCLGNRSQSLYLPTVRRVASQCRLCAPQRIISSHRARRGLTQPQYLTGHIRQQPSSLDEPLITALTQPT